MADTGTLRENHELVTDLARFKEGGLSRVAIERKWRLNEETWLAMGNDDKLVEAIELEVVRRERGGICARERALKLVAESPAVLGSILHGDGVSPRHKIESSRELRAIAATGPENKRDEDRVIIHIDLTGDAKLKQIPPDPKDIIVIDAVLPARAASKQTTEGGGDGGHI